MRERRPLFYAEWCHRTEGKPSKSGHEGCMTFSACVGFDDVRSYSGEGAFHSSFTAYALGKLGYHTPRVEAVYGITINDAKVTPGYGFIDDIELCAGGV